MKSRHELCFCESQACVITGAAQPRSKEDLPQLETRFLVSEDKLATAARQDVELCPA